MRWACPKLIWSVTQWAGRWLWSSHLPILNVRIPGIDCKRRTRSEIDGEYIDGFITASRRKDLKPHLEKLFADPKLVGRQLVEDILKYKRLDGVETALRTIAISFVPEGKQAVVLRERLGQLPMPILVIWGAEDRILPVVAYPGSAAKRQDRGSRREPATWCTWRPRPRSTGRSMHSGNSRHTPPGDLICSPVPSVGDRFQRSCWSPFTLTLQ